MPASSSADLPRCIETDSSKINETPSEVVYYRTTEPVTASNEQYSIELFLPRTVEHYYAFV